MRLEIDACGRRVVAEVADTNMSPREMLAEMLAVWQATDGRQPHGAGVYGFSQERKGCQSSPMNLGGNGREFVTEPRAGYDG